MVAVAANLLVAAQRAQIGSGSVETGVVEDYVIGVALLLDGEIRSDVGS